VRHTSLTGEPAAGPQGAFLAHDPEFAAVLGASPRLVRVVETDAHEGPVYVPAEDALYFTTLPRRSGASGLPEVAVKRLALDGERFPLEQDRVSVVLPVTRVANGMTLDLQGRLVVCEQGTPTEPARISRLDPASGQVEAVVDGFGGLPLNSPNDVVVRRDGTVWFTDPSYGYLQGFRPEPRLGDYVYRCDPRSGRLAVVADCFTKPNGLAFAPDERILYVTDSGANQEPGSYHAGLPHHVVAFDVRDGRHLTGQRLLAVTVPGFPDGIKVDAAGRVYASAGSGVQVFTSAGDLIGEIRLPGAVNFAFGGPGGNVLFITTDTAIWAAVLAATAPAAGRQQHTRERSVTSMGSVRTRRALDAGGVAAVMTAAEQTALAKGYRVVIAVVDAWGHVLQLRRTEGAQPASDKVAMDKARTAAIFVRPSREIEQQVSGGRLGALALHGAVALTGGVPLRVDGEVVGAVGTSGETPDEDESVSIAGAAAPFSTVEVPALSREQARQAAEAVGTAATARGVAPVVSVVDAGGELVYLWRPDAAQVASVAVTTDKARTAALYRRPSKDFEEQAAHGRPSALHLGGAVPLQGGMPILHDGEVVGAVGVSGASSADEDQELAVLGAQAAAAATGRAEATFFSRTAVDARFQTGGLLLEAPGYKVDAARRTAPGEVEYHERVVDIMHVVEGGATVVTGGEMVEPRSVGAGELRARSLRGGTTRELATGDVLVIPAGVPHQFVAVSDPFLYFVAKVER